MSEPPALQFPPASFFMRLLAHIIDSALWSFIIGSVMMGLFWEEIMRWAQQVMADAMAGAHTAPSQPPLPLWFSVIFEYCVPIAVLLILWKWKAATPGKMLLGMRIVDAESFGPPTLKQCVLRMLGYVPPMIPLTFLSLAGISPQPLLMVGAAVFTCPLLWGFLSIINDPNRQGWHDKLAGTLVIKFR